LGGTSSLGEIDGAFCDGRFNVNLDGRKMVGTAQRWRQSQGGQRPVGLVHGAMLMDNERESMVAAVNRFNEACGLEQRVRAQSHIALHEKFNAPQALARLDELFRLMLAQMFSPACSYLPFSSACTEDHHGLAAHMHQLLFFQILEYTADHLP
jgi:hypothetical protein